MTTLYKAVPKFLLIPCLFTLAQTAAADTEPSSPWSAFAELGFVQSSGNTDSSNLNLDLGIGYERGLWSHQFDAQAFKVTSNDTDLANSQQLDYAIRRKLSAKRNIFLAFGYLDDEFDGLSEQESVAAGFGYKVYDTDERFWELSIGAGYRNVSEEMIQEDDGGEDGSFTSQDLSLDGATAVFKSELNFALTDTARVIDVLFIEAGSGNTLLRNELSLNVDISDSIFLSAGLQVRHNTDVSFNEEDTETITSLNLGYRFGGSN